MRRLWRAVVLGNSIQRFAFCVFIMFLLLPILASPGFSVVNRDRSFFVPKMGIACAIVLWLLGTARAWFDLREADRAHLRRYDP